MNSTARRSLNEPPPVSDGDRPSPPHSCGMLCALANNAPYLGRSAEGIEKFVDAVHWASVQFTPHGVKAKRTAQNATVLAAMENPNQRLAAARERSGFKGPTDAARRYHWNENTYRSHENGQRGLSKKAAQKYAKAFKVSSGWLLYSEGEFRLTKPSMAPLVGYVGAGSQAHLFSEGQGNLDEVAAPDGSTDDTVAVEIRGESLGALFDRWLVFYDDVRRPVTSDLIGRLCIVGLDDGRVLIKKVNRGERRGRYNLISQFEPPIYDAEIEWAALVKSMMPR